MSKMIVISVLVLMLLARVEAGAEFDGLLEKMVDVHDRMGVAHAAGASAQVDALVVEAVAQSKELRDMVEETKKADVVPAARKVQHRRLLALVHQVAGELVRIFSTMQRNVGSFQKNHKITGRLLSESARLSKRLDALLL